MEKKIYINYDAREFYNSYEEVFEYFKDHENTYYLEDYLEEHYSLETIFNFSEEEKEKVRGNYTEKIKKYCDEWVEEHFEVIDIDIIFK